MSEHTSTARPETLFSCVAPTAERVFLAGTFNAWDPAAMPMLRDPSGSWTLSLDLPPGAYEYKFVVDGQWCCEPGCDGEYHGCPKCVANPLGTMNRTITVESTR